jgi:hypothetical protein
MLSVFALYARGLDTGRFAPLAVAALVLNFAAATRYDAWMYIPLLAVLPGLTGRPPRLAPRHAVGFALLCLPFPLLWMLGNHLAHGDPLYPMTYIDDFHRAWAARSGGGWNEIWLRMQGVGFWPAVATASLTPGVGLLGMAGVAAAWRGRPGTRWLIVAALAPLAYYAFRTAVLVDFVPLARFAAVPMAVLLVFVEPGFRWCVARWGPGPARTVARVSAVLAVAMPVSLGLLTFRQDGHVRDVLRPLSPTSTNSRAVVEAARFVQAEAAASPNALALDSDAGYRDLTFAFFSHVPEARLVRHRWPQFELRLRELQPEFLVRFDEGELVGGSNVALEGRRLTVAGAAYVELGGFRAPVHVYRRSREPAARPE